MGINPVHSKCPLCHVEPGQPCVNMKFKVLGGTLVQSPTFHEDRIEIAKLRRCRKCRAKPGQPCRNIRGRIMHGPHERPTR